MDDIIMISVSAYLQLGHLTLIRIGYVAVTVVQ